ncbi:glycosyltransferase family A protein [Dyadobacter sp. NIV53]|uniref:glycosyltransferase family A protein n=1 Tax=Dyadobacter sp. NIV53 TaxID=2861765 RepID=UPI001C871B52|nr:glycosyltransferase family A protein [Dyadobacter sp. NIV53]
MIKPAIAVVTYNRPVSLKRLLSSLERAQYPVNGIELIISIDYQDSDSHQEVVEIANAFEWKHGNKTVIPHVANLGLRKHVLLCGNMSATYGSLIMLEDDVFVSPQFYNYSLQMLTAYGNEDYIAGISLYKHEWNVNSARPFIASNNGFDIFFMQFAQSWGQCWTSAMWKKFHDWYIQNEQELVSQDEIPAFVTSWPKSSWLKYFITYVVKTDKYFVYPQVSLSTNFSDAGTHNKINNTKYQVPLQTSFLNYKTPSLKEAVKYDAFFERKEMGIMISVQDSELLVNLYGTKTNTNKRYLLSMAAEPLKLSSHLV